MSSSLRLFFDVSVVCGCPSGLCFVYVEEGGEEAYEEREVRERERLQTHKYITFVNRLVVYVKSFIPYVFLQGLIQQMWLMEGLSQNSHAHHNLDRQPWLTTTDTLTTVSFEKKKNFNFHPALLTSLMGMKPLLLHYTGCERQSKVVVVVL